MTTPSPALLRFLLLYGAIYAAFGVQSPFLPPLLAHLGLGPELIGLALGVGTAARIIAGPVAGRSADARGRPKSVLGLCLVLSALASLGYLWAGGIWAVILVSILQSMALAPIAPIADALALPSAAAARPDGSAPGFPYGWVRGAGSAAFIIGAIGGGAAVSRLGIPVVVWLNAVLLLAATATLAGLPVLRRVPVAQAAPRGAVRTLLRMPLFRRVTLVAALVLGSHALHDSFAMIRWAHAGIGAEAAGLLWAESVAAEVVVFLVIGPPLLNALGPRGAALLAAAAGAVRWAVSAQTAWLPAVAMIQPLHGITFALLHLACMRLLAEIVPSGMAATALTLYGTVAIGATAALLTVASGAIYAHVGAFGFWFMTALCLAAVPVAWGLRASNH